MTRPFLDPDYIPEETSARLAYSGGKLDRLSEDRSETCVADALAAPDTRVMGFARGRVLISFAGDDPRGVFRVSELEPFEPQLEKAVMLGSGAGADSDMLAVPLGINPDDEDFKLPEPFRAIDYRSLARQSLLPHDELGNAAYGGSMLAWHATNRFCARCGAASEMKAGGAKRVCTSCEKEHFPRTDPVVIMLTVNGDKCLLGRSHHFLPGMYSALAGFVEPGETIESAVRRETFEEAGVKVGEVRYLASQPWPFPNSLMFGCQGVAMSDEITIDPVEIEDACWVTREEMMAATAGQRPDMKPARKGSIARFLIEKWLADALD